MNSIPERSSLSNQVIKVLRDDLTSGMWSEWLPSERTLCERLRVSRQTIRAALSELRREGLIVVAHGRRSRIVLHNDTEQKRPVSKVVCILSRVPFHMLRPFAMFLVDEIRGRLAEAGYSLEFETGSRYYNRRPHKALERLVQEKSVACWALLQATKQIQTWFAEKGLPAVVHGSPHPGVNLPSVELDYRATCRHAGEILFAKGYRRIVLLISDIGVGGDEESKQGFLESARSMPGMNACFVIVKHNNTVAGICAKLNNLLRSSAQPTALLVANSMHVMTVMGHLLRSGLRVPGDVAVMSREDDSFLAYSVPSVERYSCAPAHFASKAAHLILQVVRGETVPRQRVRLMPKLIKGESVGVITMRTDTSTTCSRRCR